ncbi:glycosyltransferase [Kineosporia babensis]|uniref:Glycosyl transferase family 28 C-terminal domain-containing protein n=1 Tax=Kineosporia babensis TaxID=499548 RepID=A0A9X1NND0_9ACTN|nr:glycosyltransferase [Kineosporia babensis]MCD5316311.1 hypothetical protein [Kineosporia babensis]
MQPILYYVHHQGTGHWRRALAVAAELDRPVVFLSSVAPPDALPPSGTYVALPLDIPADPENHDAHGHLHWAPVHQAGLLARHRFILEAAERYQPALAVVDVSVEVTVLLRTSGVPVVSVRLPGQRDDCAHALGFGLSDQIVTPVPSAWGLHAGLPRTQAVGLVTRARPVPLQGNNNGRPRAVIIIGTGGSRIDARTCAEIAADLPEHDVTVAGLSPAKLSVLPDNLYFEGRVKDAAPFIRSASVVIGNTGLGTVGEVLAAGKPFVALPEPRAFGEQEVTARALEETGAAAVLWDLPHPAVGDEPGAGAGGRTVTGLCAGTGRRTVVNRHPDGDDCVRDELRAETDGHAATELRTGMDRHAGTNGHDGRDQHVGPARLAEAPPYASAAQFAGEAVDSAPARPSTWAEAVQHAMLLRSDHYPARGITDGAVRFAQIIEAQASLHSTSRGTLLPRPADEAQLAPSPRSADEPQLAR